VRRGGVGPLDAWSVGGWREKAGRVLESRVMFYESITRGCFFDSDCDDAICSSEFSDPFFKAPTP